MTTRELAFVDEYPKDWNGKEAAIRAKFAPKYAERYAYQLLQRVDIQAALKAKTKALTKKAEVSQERLLAEFIRLGLSSMGDFVSWDAEGNVTVKPSAELTKGQKAAIKKFESDKVVTVDQEGRSETRSKLKIELHPKESPLTKLGEKYGLFPKTDKPGDTYIQSNFCRSTDPIDLSKLSLEDQVKLQELIRKAAVTVVGEGKT